MSGSLETRSVGGREADHDPSPDHSTAADSMEALLAAVAAAPPVHLEGADAGSLDPGAVVDETYRVQRQLGAGGMGVVHLAEHIELRRNVALKLHRGVVDSRELARLRREARVMARLQHPNVLAVHGVGTHEGRMFIAMEYAEGGTLRQWLETDRPWREIVTMLAQAGRGLAAAHRVGVVHRDFKPDNVLIGADGQARVGDFGLARGTDDPSLVATGDDEVAVVDEDMRRFTMTGSVVGTPAYMSPEQFDGIDVGPASDQFSFCVMLYEAVAGHRPFAGRSSLELADAVHEGRLTPPAPDVRVPRALLEVLRKGLRPLPGDRHRSVETLVDTLERLVGARRRRLRWALGAATVAVAVGVGTQVAALIGQQPCTGVEQAMSDQAWSADRRQQVLEAWPRLDSPAREGVLAELDGFAADWGTKRTQVCEATRVRDEQSEHVFGLRMACLDRAAGRFDGLTTTLAEGPASPRDGLDPELIGDALPALEPCDDIDTLDTLHNRFSSRSARDSTERDRAYTEGGTLLTRAAVRQRLGTPGVEDLVQQALRLAQDHALPLVESQALTMLGEQKLLAGDVEGAAQYQTRALELAFEEGDDEASADLAVGQAQISLFADHPEQASLHLEYARAFISRVRDAPVAHRLRQRADVLEGQLWVDQGKHDAALEVLVPVADDPGVDPMLRRSALMAWGRAEKALGNHERALRTWGQLVELLTAMRGPDDPEIAVVLLSMGRLRVSIGQEQAALPELRRAEEIVVATHGPQHPSLIKILGRRGVAQRRLGQLEAARTTQHRSLALRQAVRGADHISVAHARDELGELARLRGDLPRAMEHLQRALELREQHQGAHSPKLAGTLTRIGHVHLLAGREAESEAVLQRALDLRSADTADAVDLAATELLLARAIVARKPAKARMLATAARDRIHSTSAADRRVREEAAQWLDDNPGPNGE